MPHGWTEILCDRHQVAPGGDEVMECLTHLTASLANAANEMRLRDESPQASLRDDVERSVVAERGPDLPEDPGHGFQVMGEHLRTRAEDTGEQIRATVEVRDEEFDSAARLRNMNLTNG